MHGIPADLQILKVKTWGLLKELACRDPYRATKQHLVEYQCIGVGHNPNLEQKQEPQSCVAGSNKGPTTQAGWT